MSFQTQAFKISASHNEDNSKFSSSIRGKASLSDIYNEGFSQKKFQRSQSKEQTQVRVNCSLMQRPSLDSFSGLNKSNSSYSSISSKNNKTLSQSSQKIIDGSFISNSKFITEPLKQKKCRQYNAFCDLLKDQDNTVFKNKHYDQRGSMKIDKENEEFFPFKLITGSSKVVAPHATPIETFSAKTIQLQNCSIKDSSFFASKYPKTQKSEITNFSTEPSISEHREKKKMTSFGLQTDSKRFTSNFANTDLIRVCSVKSQTDQTVKSYQRLIQEMQNKIDQLDKDKRELKNKLASSIKENEIFSKLLKDAESKSFFKKPSVHQTYTPKSLNVSVNRTRQNDLENQVKSLKQEVELLKNHKFQQIIEAIKSQNASLLKQLQSMSLRCRILEQYNNEVVSLQQQNRKLKTEIKFYRASSKQSSSQIQRLKGQNKRLRMNHFATMENSKLCERFSQWGSETDSLNLSISMVRQ